MSKFRDARHAKIISGITTCRFLNTIHAMGACSKIPNNMFLWGERGESICLLHKYEYVEGSDAFIHRHTKHFKPTPKIDKVSYDKLDYFLHTIGKMSTGLRKIDREFNCDDFWDMLGRLYGDE